MPSYTVLYFRVKYNTQGSKSTCSPGEEPIRQKLSRTMSCSTEEQGTRYSDERQAYNLKHATIDSKIKVNFFSECCPWATIYHKKH